MAVKTLNLNSSSAISSASYDSEAQTLTIVFVNGNSYTHDGVPDYLINDFEAAPSPGKFWNSRIKGVF